MTEIPGGIEDESGRVYTDPQAEFELIGKLLARPGDFMDLDPEFPSALSDPFAAKFYSAIGNLILIDDQVTPEAVLTGANVDPAYQLFPTSNALETLQWLVGAARGDVTGQSVIDLADWIAQCAENRWTRAEADRARENAGQPFKSKMGAVSWIERNDSDAEYEYIVEDLIPENEKSIVIGPSGSGKSFWTYTLCMAGARGIPFFGRRILQPFGVIWIAFEAQRGQKARWRAYAKHHGLADDEMLPFSALLKPVPLWPITETLLQEYVTELRGVAQRDFPGVKLKLLTVDTHNAGTPGASEIDSETAGRIRQFYDAIATKMECALLIIGHTNKEGKHRGNEQLTNNIDTVIVVEKQMKQDGPRAKPYEIKDDNGATIRMMTVAKQREGKDGVVEKFVLNFIEDGTVDKYGKPRTSGVVAEAVIANPEDQIEEARGAVAAGKPINIGSKVSRLTAVYLQCVIAEMNENGLAVPASLHLPRSIMRVANIDKVKERFRKLSARKDGETNTNFAKRTTAAIERAQADLSLKKITGQHNEFIWWANKAVKDLPETQPVRQASLFFEGIADGGLGDDEFFN